MATPPKHATYATTVVACNRVPDAADHQCCLSAKLELRRYKDERTCGMAVVWTKITGPALVICERTARLRARDFGGGTKTICAVY